MTQSLTNSSDKFQYALLQGQCFNIKYCPFDPNLLGVVTCNSYGMVGSGKVYFLEVYPRLKERISFAWPFGLFDISWCPFNNYLAVTGSSDGGVQIWDVFGRIPVKAMKEHRLECSAVDWNPSNQTFLSASWDGSLKLWDSNQSSSLCTFLNHKEYINDISWNPASPNIFVSASNDHTVQLWNTNGPPVPNLIIAAHNFPVTSCNWSRFDSNILISGGTDGIIRGWDTRNVLQPTFQIKASENSLRRIAFSPNISSRIVCVGYDQCTNIFDIVSCDNIFKYKHKEVVYGVDWSKHNADELADCGWDCSIKIHKL